MQLIKKVVDGVASREVAARGGYCGVVFLWIVPLFQRLRGVRQRGERWTALSQQSQTLTSESSDA